MYGNIHMRCMSDNPITEIVKGFVLSHAALCCQWYEQVGDISISPDWHQYFLTPKFYFFLIL